MIMVLAWLNHGHWVTETTTEAIHYSADKKTLEISRKAWLLSGVSEHYIDHYFCNLKS